MTQIAYSSLEELESQREDLLNKFGGKLPEYLTDYFDIQEKRININDTKKTLYEKGVAKDQITNYLYGAKGSKKLDYEDVDEKPINKEKPIKNIDSKELELTQKEVDTLIQVCESNIYAFAVRYFGHYLKKPSSRFHKYLYGYINRKFSKKKRRSFKKAIAAPRSGAKSSIISVILPIWCVCYGKKKFIVITSDTARKAESFLEDLKRELTLNEKLAKDFPDIVGKGPMWRVDEIITNNDIKVKVFGTGNNIRGERFGVHRPDLFIGDDLESRDSIKSALVRDDIKNNWFNKDVIFLGGDEDSTDFLIVGTILGKDALLNSLMQPEEYPDWESKRFSAVIKFSISEKWQEWETIFKNSLSHSRIQEAYDFFKENEAEMLEGTEVLWPEGEPYYKLMVAKISDESGFSTEKMNDPSDPTKILVRLEQLKFLNFNTNPKVQDILKNPRTQRFAALDPSLGKSKTSDNSVIVTLAKCPDTGVLFVEDFDVKRRSIQDQVDIIIDKYDKYRHQLISIETNAFQIVIAELLKKKSRKLNAYIPIKELPNYSDKHMRIESISPLLKDGTVVFDSVKYSNNISYKHAINEIVTYQIGVAHDDCFDALEMAIRICREKRFSMLTKQNKK